MKTGKSTKHYTSRHFETNKDTILKLYVNKVFNKVNSIYKISYIYLQPFFGNNIFHKKHQQTGEKTNRFEHVFT